MVARFVIGSVTIDVIVDDLVLFEYAAAVVTLAIIGFGAFVVITTLRLEVYERLLACVDRVCLLNLFHSQLLMRFCSFVSVCFCMFAHIKMFVFNHLNFPVYTYI